MRQLPEFAYLTSDEINGVKIISLEHPFIVASVSVYKREDERVAERLEDMAQGRYPIAKIPGYAIFLTMFTSLEPCKNGELQQAVLNDMAQFYYNDKVVNKPGSFMKSEETGSVERRIVGIGRVMRERKNKAKKED